ncbi:MAG: hypothetical protein V3R85_04725, partial [Alphaproteobacteria bacterium]
TTDAIRDKAGHPRLLSDLRRLVRRYSRGWSRLVISDAFKDGNLTANPRWVVESGDFSVGRAGLITRHGADRAPALDAAAPPPPPPVTEPERQPGFGEAVIGTLLQELTRGRESERAAPEESTAPEPIQHQPTQPVVSAREGRLWTEVAIPNAFALHVTLRSRGNTGGAFEIGVGQGAPANGYRLVYSPQGTPSLSLVRVGVRGATILRSARQPVRLEDGKQHKLKLARDIVGEMTVEVDGKRRLVLRDASFRDDFDRIVLRNRGGDYTLRGIAVYGAP